ncbi:unnamed protein product [Coregonus sp. 'balchen']|nr:unnamed protein product [Coregonus sp. 'balchen']
MGFADLLNDVGGFGRFQWIHVTMLSIPGLLMASQNLLNNFTAGMPGHHCTIPNRTSIASNQNISLSEVDDRQLLHAFIPMDASGTKLSKCTRYVEAQWHLLESNVSVIGRQANFTEPETELCLDGWTYDKTEFLSTVVSEWDLVCTLRPMKQMSQTIYMGGVLAGAIIFGGLSDRFGRKSLLIWSYFQLATLGTCTAFSPSFMTYCIFRFMTGMAVSGVEWIPTKSRTLVGTLSSFFFTFGQMVLAGIAHSLRDWRKLQVAVCAPFFLFFLYSWWYSESARWLVLNRRSDEALKHIHRVARINRKPEMVEKITLEKFGVNIYLIQIIFGMVDFPAKLVALGSLTFLGRRITQGTCLLMSALMIFANTFVPTDMQSIRTTLACLGKAFTSSSFTCIYLFTGELYPTVIRQTGMGFTSTMARVGSMAAPAVLILEEVLPALPSMIYGGAAVVAGIIAFFLPETLDIPLPDTIEDVEEKWASKKPDAEKLAEKETVALREMKEGAVEGDGEITGLKAL